MSLASSVNSMNSAAAQHRNEAQPRAAAEPARTLLKGSDEAAVLNIDLAGLPLPKVGGLHVDGFKPSLFQRLFGKR